MTMASEWDAALDEFRKRSAHWAALMPYCSAIIPVLERLRADPRVGTVALQVSHATLVIEVGDRNRRVGLCWDGERHYGVFFVDPGFEFSERRAVTEHDVVETVVRYLDHLRA
jgi:hypothetical protein